MPRRLTHLTEEEEAEAISVALANANAMKPYVRHADDPVLVESVTPAGLRARAKILRGKLRGKLDIMNDGYSTARHLELAADRIEELEGYEEAKRIREALLRAPL